MALFVDIPLFFKRSCVLALIVALAFQVKAQTPSQPVQKLFEQGQLLEKTSRDKAFDSFLQATRLSRHQSTDFHLQALFKTVYLGYILEGDREKKAFAELRRSMGLLSQTTSSDSLVADLFYYGGLWFKSIVVKPDSAIICFDNSLKIRLSNKEGNSEMVARCYHGLADVYKYSLYDFNAAEKNYEKVLEIREGLKKRDDFEIARTYFSLAATNRSQRDFEKAISYGSRTVDIVEKLGESEFLDATYSIMGNIYRDIGQYDSARRLYALAIASNKKNYHGQPNERLAAFYQGLGEVLKAEHKFDEAISNYQLSLLLFEAVEVTEKTIYLHCLQQLGELYALKNDATRAFELYRQAQRIQSEAHFEKTGVASVLNLSIGNLFEKLGRIDSALNYYQKSLTSAVKNFNSNAVGDNPELNDIELNSFVYPALMAKASALMVQFRQTNKNIYATTALSCYSLAENVLTSARNSLDMEEAKWSYLDLNFGLFDESISAVYELNQLTPNDSLLRLAFHYFESSKSRSFAEAIQAATYSNPAILTDTLLSERQNLKTSLFKLKDQLKKVTDGNRVRSIRGLIVDLDRRMKLNANEIEQKYPQYFRNQSGYELPQVADVQKLASQEHLFLLEYFWGDKFVYGIGISEQKIIFRRVGSADSLAKVIKSLSTSFNTSNSGSDLASFQIFTQEAFGLYNQLIFPFEFQGMKMRTVIIPDGLLGIVPFEALISKRSQQARVNYWSLDYLVKQRTFAYAFSSFQLLHQRPTRVSNPVFVAFGLTGQTFLPASRNNSSGGAARELALLEKHFPKGKFFLGEHATREQFIRNAGSADIIHLAVHGQGDTENDYSASLYFKDDNDSHQTGEFHWYELYTMKLNASLAVLSSCESGIGKSYKGEGMLSMANGFVQSGCNSVVLGLWKVNDQSSIGLMGKFYEGLSEGGYVDEALAEAKRDYLSKADEFSAHPKIWASLVVFGDQQVIKKNKDPWLLITGVLILLTAGAGFLILRRRSRSL